MMPPHTLQDGRYVLEAPLGEGGMAQVFRAYDHRLRRWRAVKLLLPEFARRPKLRLRFEGEAHAMALLEHRHIVRVYDVGAEGDQAYIVMELCPGGALDDWLEAHGAMPPRMAVDVMLEVCAGIAMAHSEGVIHRDIKPQNVLIDRHGTCKVTDFGIAHLEAADLTRTGSVMGTLGYMAPEQRSDSKSVDSRADIYALGATLYHLVTQRTSMDLFAASEDETILEGVPEPLAALIRKATSYRPDGRYATVDEMISALEALVPELAADPTGTPDLRPAPTAERPVPVAPPPPSRSAAAPKTTLLPPPEQGPTLSPRTGPGQTLLPPAAGAVTPSASDRLKSLPWVPHTERGTGGEVRTPEPRSARSRQTDDRPPAYLAEEPQPSYLDDDQPSYIDQSSRAPRPSGLDWSESDAIRTERHYLDPDAGKGLSAEEAAKGAWAGFTEGLVLFLQFTANPVRYLIWPSLVFFGIFSLMGFNGSKRVNAAAADTGTSLRALTSAVDKDRALIEDLVSAGAPKKVLDVHLRAYETAETEEEKAEAALALTKMLELQTVRLEGPDDPDFEKKRKRLQSRVDALGRHKSRYTEQRARWEASTDSLGARIAVQLGLAEEPPPPLE